MTQSRNKNTVLQSAIRAGVDAAMAQMTTPKNSTTRGAKKRTRKTARTFLSQPGKARGKRASRKATTRTGMPQGSVDYVLGSLKARMMAQAPLDAPGTPDTFSPPDLNLVRTAEQRDHDYAVALEHMSRSREGRLFISAIRAVLPFIWTEARHWIRGEAALPANIHPPVINAAPAKAQPVAYGVKRSKPPASKSRVKNGPTAHIRGVRSAKRA